MGVLAGAVMETVRGIRPGVQARKDSKSDIISAAPTIQGARSGFRPDRGSYAPIVASG